MSEAPLVLAVETSCDETSAAVLRGRSEVLGHIILSQDAHAMYGGVVPEIAARAHLSVIDDVVRGSLEQAGVTLDRIDVIAATAGPGLIGALLVGVTWARALAFARGLPFVPVHHMEAHLFGAAIDDPLAEPPFVALLVSGGHTMLLRVPEWDRYELLGETRDDAAGEAFDKVARILGLGFPGGPIIETRARAGNASAFAFPRPMLAAGDTPADPGFFDFSFSGLKTAVLTKVKELEAEGTLAASVDDLAASFQAAVIDVLVAKTARAVAHTGCNRVVLGGGVAASRALRDSIAIAIRPGGSVHFPSARLATDNAAMVASAAAWHFSRGRSAGDDVTARADLPFPGLIRAF